MSDEAARLRASTYESSYLEWPPSLLTGATSTISSASVYKVKSLGTSQRKTLPSSEAEATMRSLKGLLQTGHQHLKRRAGSLGVATPYQSVSRTAAVWPRNSGIWSGSLPFSDSGITAKAPPPEASQLTDKYSGLTCRRHRRQQGERQGEQGNWSHRSASFAP